MLVAVEHELLVNLVGDHNQVVLNRNLRNRLEPFLGDNAASVRSVFKDYTEGFLDELLRLAVISTFLTYVLYTVENRVWIVEGWLSYAGLLTIPFVLYALMRYLMLIYVRGEGSAPDEVLLTDRPLQLTILLWGLTFMAILYLPPVLGLV